MAAKSILLTGICGSSVRILRRRLGRTLRRRQSEGEKEPHRSILQKCIGLMITFHKRQIVAGSIHLIRSSGLAECFLVSR